MACPRGTRGKAVDIGVIVFAEEDLETASLTSTLRQLSNYSTPVRLFFYGRVGVMGKLIQIARQQRLTFQVTIPRFGNPERQIFFTEFVSFTNQMTQTWIFWDQGPTHQRHVEKLFRLIADSRVFIMA